VSGRVRRARRRGGRARAARPAHDRDVPAAGPPDPRRSSLDHEGRDRRDPPRAGPPAVTQTRPGQSSLTRCSQMPHESAAVGPGVAREADDVRAGHAVPHHRDAVALMLHLGATSMSRLRVVARRSAGSTRLPATWPGAGRIDPLEEAGRPRCWVSPRGAPPDAPRSASLDPVGFLQLTDVPDDVGQFAVSHPGLRGHVSERPVMGPNPPTDGQQERSIGVMGGAIDRMDERWSAGVPGAAGAVAPSATLDVRQLTRAGLRRKVRHDHLPSRRRASGRLAPDPIDKNH
jgi:hypothetical protein